MVGISWHSLLMFSFCCLFCFVWEWVFFLLFVCYFFSREHVTWKYFIVHLHNVFVSFGFTAHQHSTGHFFALFFFLFFSFSVCLLCFQQQTCNLAIFQCSLTQFVCFGWILQRINIVHSQIASFLCFAFTFPFLFVYVYSKTKQNKKQRPQNKTTTHKNINNM